MAKAGILGFGAYIPITRLNRSVVQSAHAWFGGQRGKGEKAISNWDEDAVTMAVEAARDCLGEFSRESIGAVWLASTTAPFADRQNAGIIKEALNLADATASLDAGGSQRAATSSLLAAIQATSSSDRPILHCAAERACPAPASQREMSRGDAASAMLVGTGNVICDLVDAHSVTADFVDHFRESGETDDYEWEARWIRDEGFGGLMANSISEALQIFGVEGGSIDHFIAPIPVRGVPEMLAKRAGIATDAIARLLDDTIGHAGAAHPTLMLADVLERARPGETILLTAFGQGCDVILLRATDQIATVKPRLGVSGLLSRRRESENYLKYLFHRNLIALDRGMRAEHDEKQSLPALWRNRRGVMALVGGKCPRTGTVQFPKSQISVNPNDRAVGTQEGYPLAERRATIMTYTADSLAYSPDPPTCYGNVEFEGGGRLMAEFTDLDPLAIAVGDEMRMMFRIKSVDERRGFRRYFWKAAPAF